MRYQGLPGPRVKESTPGMFKNEVETHRLEWVAGEGSCRGQVRCGQWAYTQLLAICSADSEPRSGSVCQRAHRTECRVSFGAVVGVQVQDQELLVQRSRLYPKAECESLFMVAWRWGGV